MDEKNQNEVKEPEVVDSSSGPNSDDKVMALLSYLHILCLIPLLTKKDSPYVQFHAKQGLVLLIAWFISWFLLFIPFVGVLVSLFLLGLSIYGLVNVMQGKQEELPLIGQFVKKIKL